MHDNSHKAQQEALGILGVNLIYACYFQSGNIDDFIDGIVHRLPPERMEIDMLRISGPDFEDTDNRIIALNLVRRGITNATMFDLAKNVMQPSTALYKKNILLMRGRFRPVTKVHIDMIERARAAFAKEKRVKPEQLEVVFELTLKDLTADGKISDKDFLDRAELLGSLGYTVMVSNYLKHYKMLEYLSSIARGNLVGVIMGIYNLHIILRFEIEKGLFEGSIRTEDIPEIWNAKMQQYLNVVPENHKQGCLQDVHWSFGGFGYFPTYSLGNLNAAHLARAARRQDPAVAAAFETADYAPLLAWMRRNIHEAGSLHR
jgi:hypothetical protein